MVFKTVFSNCIQICY